MYDTTKPYIPRIKELISQTWETPYVSVKEGVYPIVTKKFFLPEVSHTDGIGTKGVYHWKQRTFRNACLDALAMNLNDLALSRAIPYQLQDHIFIPEEDEQAILEIMANLSEECRKRNIAITGGETSIHNNMDGMELSLTISGFVKDLKPNRFCAGDLLIGIRSNGLHSSGFTTAREVFGEEFREEFTIPTKIYYEQMSHLEKTIEIHGMMHITGGAYAKLKGLLQDCNAGISRKHKLKPQHIFHEMHSRGVSDEEMYKIFNCGIGFVFSIPESDLSNLVLNEDMDVIGEVLPNGNKKVIVKSMFSRKEITI